MHRRMKQFVSNIYLKNSYQSKRARSWKSKRSLRWNVRRCHRVLSDELFCVSISFDSNTRWCSPVEFKDIKHLKRWSSRKSLSEQSQINMKLYALTVNTIIGIKRGKSRLVAIGRDWPRGFVEGIAWDPGPIAKRALSSRAGVILASECSLIYWRKS